MNVFLASLLRKALQPNVSADVPGHLRLQFPTYRLLPDAALPYLHYFDDAMCLLPGVLHAELNPTIGTALIRYDPSVTSRRQILGWMDVLIEEGIRCADDKTLVLLSEKDMVPKLRERLLARLNA